MDMNDYVLNRKTEVFASDIIWAFDLGGASIGVSPSPRWRETDRGPDEVNNSHHTEFLHKTSLFIPVELVKRKSQQEISRWLSFRNAFVTFVTNWCKRLAFRFSSLRYLTLS
jgi:hypothetical protein